MQLWQQTKNFLKKRFLLVAGVASVAVGIASQEYDNYKIAHADPVKDREMAVFSGPNDPVMNKQYYGIYEEELAPFARHRAMMEDPALKKEWKDWLSKNLDKYMNGTPMERLEGLRKVVQDSVHYAFDTRVYNRDEYLAPPLQTIKAKHGDCDDFAILYFYGARYLGFADAKVFILDAGTNLQPNHAVCLVDTSGVEEKQLLSKNIFVLDNGRAPLIHLEDFDYVPFVLIDRHGSYVLQQGITAIRDEITSEGGVSKYLKNQLGRPEVKKFIKEYLGR